MKTTFAFVALFSLWTSAYGEPALLKSKSFSAAMLPLYEGLAVPSSMYTSWPDGADPVANADWPLFPVALSGSTHFVLSNTLEFSILGEPESVAHYLEYCRANGKFRRKPAPGNDAGGCS
jgi:hypothetical protein